MKEPKIDTWPILFIEKILTSAVLPTKAHFDDLGYDLYAGEQKILPPNEITLVRTGIRAAFPGGWGAKIFDRSSVATKLGLITVAGVIDSGYRGEILVAFYNAKHVHVFAPGDKIAQLIPTKVVDWPVQETAIDINETSRSSHGFGSTGK